ncbi:hypothetical protein F8M41_013024 [Gigaspora margarita]|uniref:Uncharacterized protein n=1 Tax=Gigaspora margarita TaxID=4874 RepID=A0A8H4EPJ7_GIGMA|nr:hypothetical protein F8M41_013024 [Gigaspora margarita]
MNELQSMELSNIDYQNREKKEENNNSMSLQPMQLSVESGSTSSQRTQPICKICQATMDLGFAQTPFVDYVKRKTISNETVYYSNVLNVDVKDIIDKNVANNTSDATNIMSILLFAHQ